MRALLWILLLPATTSVAVAAEFSLPIPPVEGRLTGDVDLTAIPGAPALHWVATMDASGDLGRHVTVVADGLGTHLRIELTAYPDKPAMWKLVEGKLSLSAWQPAAEHRVSALAGLVMDGDLTVTGSGRVDRQSASGDVVVSVREASVRNPAAGWTLEGVSIGGYFAIDSAQSTVRSTAPLTMTIRTITTKRFGARNLTITGSLRDASHFEVSSGRLEIAGGDMVIGSTLADLNPVRIMADVTLNRIGLQDVAALVPAAVASASGRVDGLLRIGWSTAAGIELGTGHLILRRDEPAEVTLRPSPGLFTGRFPPWLHSLMKLPSWLVRSSLPSLEEAELGRAPIEAQSLDITFSPSPDQEGRYAVVRLTGIPKGAVTHTPVNLTANVYAPLEPLIQLGTNAKLSFGLH